MQIDITNNSNILKTNIEILLTGVQYNNCVSPSRLSVQFALNILLLALDAR